MKPHPRIRKTIKWTGAVATALLIVVWIATSWRPAHVATPWGDDIRVDRGYIVWHPTLSQRWSVDVMTPEDGGKVRVGIGGRREHVWPLLVAAFGSACMAWRLDTLARRRAPASHCPKCNYDRTGLAAGAVCPDCGGAGVPS